MVFAFFELDLEAILRTKPLSGAKVKHRGFERGTRFIALASRPASRSIVAIMSNLQAVDANHRRFDNAGSVS
jgi:hypothetical protein